MLQAATEMDEELLSWKGHFGICDAAHESLRDILLRYGIPLGHVRRGLDEETLAVDERPRPDGPPDYGGSLANAQAASPPQKSVPARVMGLTHAQSFLAESFAAGDVPLTHVGKLCQD